MKRVNRIWIYPLFSVGAILASSCQEDDEKSPTVTDIDGNVYHTVKIGTQVWMMEDLRTSHYSNGDLIETTNPVTLDIDSEGTPAYQWTPNGDDGNLEPYGRLYTWHAANDSRNLCPAGWHVPTDAEWTTLITYLGGPFVAGNKMKETGTEHWLSPNTEANNKSHFTGLPGGVRYGAGEFNDFGEVGYWWSSTTWANNDGSAWFKFLDSNGTAGGNYTDKREAMSIRCIKD